MRVFSTLILALSIGLARSASLNTTTNTTSLASAQDFPDMGFSVLRLTGSLILVLGLFLAGVWCFKNWQRITLRRGKPSRLQVLEIKPLGNKQAVFLVAYDQQRLLLGSSPNGVNLITHLPEADQLEEEPPETSFVQNLSQALTARTGS